MTEPHTPECKHKDHDRKSSYRFLHFADGLGWICSNCIELLSRRNKRLIELTEKEQNEGNSNTR